MILVQKVSHLFLSFIVTPLPLFGSLSKHLMPFLRLFHPLSIQPGMHSILLSSKKKPQLCLRKHCEQKRHNLHFHVSMWCKFIKNWWKVYNSKTPGTMVNFQQTAEMGIFSCNPQNAYRLCKKVINNQICLKAKIQQPCSPYMWGTWMTPVNQAETHWP